jgi:hypothetical protein
MSHHRMNIHMCVVCVEEEMRSRRGRKGEEKKEDERRKRGEADGRKRR